ncbi:hypothetical protein V1264_012238 [Littorina saxatilis]|uniref:Uncharacterized protein n=1 Tax=Littorina saxatilis TaxID=31220 RepID=A0AAN9BXE0_9CAEN
MRVKGKASPAAKHCLSPFWKFLHIMNGRGYSSVGSALDLCSVGRCQREFDPRFGGNLFHRVNFVCRLSSVSEPPPVYTTLGVHVKDPTIDKRVFPGKIA